MNSESPGWIFTAQEYQLTIRWDDGVVGQYKAVWLRDNCPEDRSTESGERTIDIADTPETPRIGETFRIGDAEIAIIWGDEDKTSVFDVSWLRAYCGPDPYPLSPRLRPTMWTAERAADLIRMEYADIVASEAALARWLRAIAEYGIALLRGVPCRPGEILRVARRIGPVPELHNYGLSDSSTVTWPHEHSNASPGRALHTDHPYHDPVPGVHLLHCVQTGAQGGESLFLDGYAVASYMRDQFPESFQVLAWTPVRFTSRTAESEFATDRPLIQLDALGNVEAIHYDTRFIAPLRLPQDAVASFYAAYRIFALLLRDPNFIVKLHLADGDMVALDTRRTLHGREASSPEEDAYRVQRCWIYMDVLLSRLAVIERRYGNGAET